jgi:hypothetical protein
MAMASHPSTASPSAASGGRPCRAQQCNYQSCAQGQLLECATAVCLAHAMIAVIWQLWQHLELVVAFNIYLLMDSAFPCRHATWLGATKVDGSWRVCTSVCTPAICVLAVIICCLVPALPTDMSLVGPHSWPLAQHLSPLHPVLVHAESSACVLLGSQMCSGR